MTKLIYVCEPDTGGIVEYAIRQVSALVQVRNAVTGPAEQNSLNIVFVCTPNFPVNRLPAGVQVELLPPSTLDGQKNSRCVFGKLARAGAMIRDAKRQAAAVADIVERESSTLLPPMRERDNGKSELYVLFACYKEYFSNFWAGTLRRPALQGVDMGTIAHDPVRDFAVGPRWWHRWSIRQGYSFVRDVFVHDNTPVDFGGPKPERIRVHKIPHGPLEIAAPKIGRQAMRKKYGFAEDKKDVVFLAFGQIRDGKNLDLFLKAMVKAPPEVKLLVAGAGVSGSSKPPVFYQELARKLGLADRCRWDIRRIPDDEVGDFFAACDTVLLTYSGRFRSASGVLNAAVSALKPVLASSGAGPLKKAVEEYALGAWVEPDDQAAIGRLLQVWGQTPHSCRWDDYARENSWERNAKLVSAAAGWGTTERCRRFR
jgi:glycosyltransferase involved in cell wall biosynthesis